MGTCCINSRIQELGLFKKQKHDKILHCFPAGPGIWTECGIVSRMLPLDLLVIHAAGIQTKYTVWCENINGHGGKLSF